MVLSGSEKQLQRLWGGEAPDGRYLWLPHGLFRAQGELGLTDGEFVVLLNLLTHWWKRGDLPFPSTATLAKRMGVAPRTVIRRLTGLKKKGLIRRIGRRAANPDDRAPVRYDLEGFRTKMKELGVVVEPLQATKFDGELGLPVEDLQNIPL